jgi:hypothetical protein
VINEPYIKSLRHHRNNILKSTDWVLTYDHALLLANLDEWIKYRQELRDFFSDLNKPVIFLDNSSTWDIYAMGFPREPPIIKK